MAKTFAAIDVGSYELSMKIFEVGRRMGLRQIDHVIHGIDMGSETFNNGILSFDRVEELCTVLKDFKKIMNGYRVDAYKAYGTSAIRESKNTAILIDLIEQRTGIKIEVLSNSEQRFLDYKSVALQGEKFNRFIGQSTAILDIGGGSIQLSLFDKDTLYATQKMLLGVLRIQDRMRTLDASYRQYEALVKELSQSQLNTYKKLYLKDASIENLILIDDHVATLLNSNTDIFGGENTIDVEAISSLVDKARHIGRTECAKYLSIPEDDVDLMYISLLILNEVLEITGANRIWAPGVTLCDGMAFEYAEANGLIKSSHNFEEDIKACVITMAKRYSSSRKRSQTLEKISMAIFDAMKDIGGLTERDRLLLQMASYLHDCGKYISMSNLAECSYNIIKNTEIIGISHSERIIVANVVRFNQEDFDYYEDFRDHEYIEAIDHMKIAKLTAILRVANGLDRSHKMKFQDIRVKINGDELLIFAETDEDITLEKGLFGVRGAFFKEIYNLKPLIIQKRSF